MIVSSWTITRTAGIALVGALMALVLTSGAKAQLPETGYAEIAELKTYALGDVPTYGPIELDYFEDDDAHLAARDALAESLRPQGFNILEEAQWTLSFEFGVDLIASAPGDAISSSTGDLTGEDIEETMGGSLLTREAACDPPRFYMDAKLREGSNAPTWGGRLVVTAIGCERVELAARMARELAKHIGQEVDIHGVSLP